MTKTIRANSIIGKSSSIKESEVSLYVNNITSDKNSDKKARIKFDLTKSQLNEDQKQKLQFCLESNRDVFASDLSELGHATLLKHEIILQDSIPVQSRPYRISPKMKPEIDRQLEQLEKYHIIEESISDYSSPIVLIKKKASPGVKNPEYRLCIDYRALNSKTVSQKHPTPNMNDIIDALAQNRPQFMSVLDLFSGYYQCEVHPNSRHLTAFVTSDRHLQFKRLPFGLKNSPAFFIKLTNKILKGLTGKFCAIYIDDVIVWSKTFEEHLDHLSQVFERFRKANLKFKPSKCHFAKPEVKYLGHIITKEGIKVDPEKTEAVRSFPVPRTQHDVRSFLGLCNYYRKFVKNYSKITDPLNALLAKDAKFKWTPDCQEAFECLKDKLISAPILKFPNFDLHLDIF